MLKLQVLGDPDVLLSDGGWWPTLWESDPDCKEILKSAIEGYGSLLKSRSSLPLERACSSFDYKDKWGAVIVLWTKYENEKKTY